jgi:hypothetical protein
VASAGSIAGHTDPLPSDTGSWQQQQQQPKKEPVDGFQSPQLESSRMGSVVTFKLVEKPNKKKANVATVKGLRVRMGVATGWLSAAAEIKTSALFDLAKGDLQQYFLPRGVSLPSSCSTKCLLLMYMVAAVHEGSLTLPSQPLLLKGMKFNKWMLHLFAAHQSILLLRATSQQ